MSLFYSELAVSSQLYKLEPVSWRQTRLFTQLPSKAEMGYPNLLFSLPHNSHQLEPQKMGAYN